MRLRHTRINKNQGWFLSWQILQMLLQKERVKSVHYQNIRNWSPNLIVFWLVMKQNTSFPALSKPRWFSQVPLNVLNRIDNFFILFDFFQLERKSVVNSNTNFLVCQKIVLGMWQILAIVVFVLFEALSGYPRNLLLNTTYSWLLSLFFCNFYFGHDSLFQSFLCGGKAEVRPWM